MRKLSSLILATLLALRIFAQPSPHGAAYTANCMDCHNTGSWKIDTKKLSFNHNATTFPLTGQHQAVDCRMCHVSLEFSKAGRECVSCHTDMHNQTVGTDCARCHTPNSWVVNNITEIHQRSRFPLVGAHATADCYACHKNASSNLLLFGPLGVDCIDCHRDKYVATTKPNHQQTGLSTNCIDCHNLNSFTWTGVHFNHANVKGSCVECHQANYNATSNPNHASIGFSTNCVDCHTNTSAWKPAQYRDHDAKSFPIYSGKHNGVWTSCSECHTNPSSYLQYTCIDCHDHNQSSMDSKHAGVNGYAWNSPACFACHPTGSKDGTFNHATSGFPLTGAHATTECIKCHANGYAGTSPVCYNCHSANFNQSVNPNHAAINIPHECGTCHTTLPGWKPATFPIHNNYYVIAGAHLAITNDCVSCHKGNYVTTPKLCFGCHADKYNASTNPNHVTSNFPTTCETCHSQTAWSPSTFDHNTVYPLTGAHATIAANCFACHQGNYTTTPNTCEGCHLPNYNATTNPNHNSISIPTTCITCHTTTPNWKPATFPIHNNYYILAGAHIPLDCITCHNGVYNTSTPNTCVGCHQANYNQTTNPPHATSQFPTTCADCHTQTAWTPANWNHDGLYFPIYSGKHLGKWTTCADCHANAANYSVFSCTTSCHPQASMNSAHQGVSGYSYSSAACYNCHPQGKANKLMNRPVIMRND